MNRDLPKKGGGTYPGVVYNEQAQRFLLDNLEQIMAFGAAQREPVLACLTPEFIHGIPLTSTPTSSSF